jgi:HAE1 family hydrophobic/amphiphilic exporter-1
LAAPGSEASRDEAERALVFDSWMKRAYRSLLERALRHRFLVIAAVLLLIAGSISLLPLGKIQTEFLPPFDQGKLVVDLNLGAGADLDRTDAAVRELETHLLALPEVDVVFSQIGTDSGSNFANLIIRLKDKSLRAKGQSEMANELRSWAAGRPGANYSVREESLVSQTSIEGSKPFILNITGPDRAVLTKLAERMETIVQATPGVVDVQNSIRARQTELSVIVDRLALSEYGLAASDVATSLRVAFAGAKAGVYREAGNEYDMIVRFRSDQTRTPLDVASIRIRGATGAMVSIGQVARIKRDDSASTLERVGRSNVVTVSSNLQGRPLGAVTADVKERIAAFDFPPGYECKLVGESSLMSGSFASLVTALVASILLVYFVLVVLYESWLTPLIRLLSLPAGIIGGLAAMAITGKTINIISFIGIIMLDGLVSKNGTLLIDYTNTLMKRGRSIHDALIESGATRLRPIIMTSATMIVGMLPLALSTGASSEIKSGMAVVLIGGLVSSTLVSPFLIPVVYAIIEEARERRALRRANKKETIA